MTPTPLILASASPRRAELLRQAGIPFLAVPSRIRETFPRNSRPGGLETGLALSKAREVAARLKRRDPGFSSWVLGADTVVWLGERPLAKPRDFTEARAMLRGLSGRAHRVVTGLALLGPGREGPRLAAEATRVRFRKLSEGEIRDYVATGEPLDKAGAYGIQGRAGAFVSRIEGCYFNVVGLPLARLSAMLEAEGRQSPPL